MHLFWHAETFFHLHLGFDCFISHHISDIDAVLQKTTKLKDNKLVESPSFTGKVLVVTGAGSGLGRSCAKAFAKLGASVVVNDIVNPDDTVKEILSERDSAVGHKGSAEDGDGIVKQAVTSFGRIDIIIKNAGIVRDKSFIKMDDKSWDQVVAVHLRDTYIVSRPACSYMIGQGYSRIINTTSISGIYDNFGQAKYAAAKAGINGLSKSLARAGASHNVLVNTIAPAAGTNMSKSVMTEEMIQATKPEWNAPFVVAICSDSISPPPTGQLFELGPGWLASTRLRQCESYDLSRSDWLTPECVLNKWVRNLGSGSESEAKL